MKLLLPFAAYFTMSLISLSCESATAQEQAFHHPTGFRFEHPVEWDVQQVDEGISLIPDDAARDDSGEPAEMFFIASQPAPGVNRPDDPQILAFLEHTFAPLRRTGEVNTAQSALGPAATLTFEGRAGSHHVRQGVYVVIHEGEGIYLLHIARRDLYEQRESAARRLFASFDWGDPQTRIRSVDAQTSGTGGEAPSGHLDQQLIRTWQRSSTSGSTGSGGAVYVSDQDQFTFAPDGSLTYSSSSTVNASVPGISGQASGDPDALGGRWSIEGGLLVIRWDTGEVGHYEYSVFIHSDGMPALKIQEPGGNPVYYR